MSIQSDTRALSRAQLRITRRCLQLACVHASASTSDSDPTSASASDRALDAAVRGAQRSGGTSFLPEVL